MKIFTPNIRSLLPALLVLTGLFWWYHGLYVHYSLFGDDPAVLVGSLSSPVTWFTEGYSKYFAVYPEWGVSGTDFLRPGVNLLVRLSYLAFGTHYFYYFVSFYAAQGFLCVLVVLIARALQLPSRLLPSLAVLTALSPAFVSYGLTIENFQFDVWCGLFAVLAFYLLLLRRYGVAVLALTLAVFTKEAALYAPVAACLTVYLQTRRRVLSGLMLAPLAVWLLVRKFIFHGNVSHLYALPVNNLSSLSLGIARGFLTWPLGIVNDHAIADLVHQRSLHGHVADALIMAVNVMLWPLLVVCTLDLIRGLRKASPAEDYSSTGRQALTIWLAGALSFGVLVAPGQRFGGSIYPLLVLFFSILLLEGRGRGGNRLAAFAVGALAVSFGFNVLHTLRHADADDLHAMQAMRQLLSALREHRGDAEKIYVLNAPAAYSGPQSLAALASTTADVVVLNEFKGCSASQGGSVMMQSSGDHADISSVLPACAEYIFYGVPYPKLAEGITGSLGRGNFAVYNFPDARISSIGVRDGQIRSIDFGPRLRLTLAPPADKSHILLYYDWTAGAYRCAGVACRNNSAPTS